LCVPCVCECVCVFEYLCARTKRVVYMYYYRYRKNSLVVDSFSGIGSSMYTIYRERGVCVCVNVFVNICVVCIQSH